MFLTEITISRLPTTTSDVVPSTNKSDYVDRLSKSTARTGVSDDTLDDSVEQQLDMIDKSESDEGSPEDLNNLEDQQPSGAESEDPNKAGLTRVVTGAHMVYKRAQPDGTFSELWSYKSDDVKNTMKTRNSILAGTDIELSKLRSQDGAQSYDVWSVGNIELLQIIGLPN